MNPKSPIGPGQDEMLNMDNTIKKEALPIDSTNDFTDEEEAEFERIEFNKTYRPWETATEEELKLARAALARIARNEPESEPEENSLFLSLKQLAESADEYIQEYLDIYNKIDILIIESEQLGEISSVRMGQKDIKELLDRASKISRTFFIASKDQYYKIKLASEISRFNQIKKK